MPGLFGFVRIEEQNHLDAGFSESVWAEMARRLRHHSSHQIDRWVDLEAGLIIGRIGAPHVNLVPWARANGVDESANSRAFIAGILHVVPGAGQAGTSPEGDSPLDHGRLTEFRGFYALLLQKDRPREIVIAVDRRASIPVYFAECGGLLFFAPEIKAFLGVPGLAREVDPAALAVFLASGHTLCNQTLFRSVRRLGGGEALRIQGGRVEQTVYWRFLPGTTAPTESETELEERLGELVQQATKRNLGDLDRTIIYLSGGTDSRTVLGGALETVGGDGTRLHTVSWGTNPGVSTSDVAIAGRIAAALGLRHRFVQRSTENYSRNFSLVNYLVDAQSDVAAYHPHEYQIMEILLEAGFTRALRGDVVFGMRSPVPVRSMAGALAEVGLRRLQGLERVPQFTWHGVYRQLCDASEAAIDSALVPVRDLGPNEAKDSLYFTHRLQGYLNTAAYYKQLLLDNRNVLLDESILDFMTMIPTRLRIGKLLYRRAMARRYPRLWRFEFAQHHNLEDWSLLLGTDTSVRRFVAQQLDDGTSGIWEYFDRAALRNMLDALTKLSSEPRAAAHRWRPVRKRLGRALFYVVPQVAAAVRERNGSRELAPHHALMRVLVLKHWFDTFLSSDGSLQSSQVLPP